MNRMYVSFMQPVCLSLQGGLPCSPFPAAYIFQSAVFNCMTLCTAYAAEMQSNDGDGALVMFFFFLSYFINILNAIVNCWNWFII